MKAKEYKIPVEWKMYGYVTVEADTEELAAQVAESDMGIGLPDNGAYAEGSWKVDWEEIQKTT